MWEFGISQVLLGVILTKVNESVHGYCLRTIYVVKEILCLKNPQFLKIIFC